MTFQKEDSAGYLLHHVARLFSKTLRMHLEPLGIVPGQFGVLLVLWEKEGVTQKELLEHLDVEQATLGNTLTRMQRDGLIRRTKHEADGRAQQIWLTSKAKQVREAALQATLQANQCALSALDDQEVAVLLTLLKKILFASR